MRQLLLNDFMYRSLNLQTRQRPQVVECHGDDQLRRYDLRTSAIDGSEGRAQNFMAAHDLADAPLEDRLIARRRHAERIKDIEIG